MIPAAQVAVVEYIKQIVWSVIGVDPSSTCGQGIKGNKNKCGTGGDNDQH